MREIDIPSSNAISVWGRDKYENFEREVHAQGYSFAMRYVINNNYETILFDTVKNYVLIFHSNGQVDFLVQNVHKPVPSAIKSLRNITSVVVDRSSCNLAWLASLRQLKRLYIRDCKYKDLPSSLEQLKQLNILWLDRSGLEALPECVREMIGLQEITIRHQTTKGFILPEWLDELSNLTMLDLRSCYLKTLPLSLLNSTLEFNWNSDDIENGILLNGSQFEDQKINLSLLQQPKEYIKAFLTGTLRIAFECKIVFLGDANSGKTSLIDRIINNRFQEHPPTDGIDIQTWSQVIEGLPVKLRFMDFGGQEIMHAVHRCFMTRNTVYVLVCESRNDTNLDRTAIRWMENIKEFAGECPVILALNKADENENAKVDETNLKRMNPSLQCVFRTSAKWEQDLGTKQLKQAINKAALSIIKEASGNEVILELQQRLENMKKNYLTRTEYKALCEECGLTDTLGIMSLDYFNNIGICYSYSTSELNATLEDLRVLNPTWLTNGVYRLVLHTRKDGFLSHTEIKKSLYNNERNGNTGFFCYSAKETEFILHVMRKFQISHKIGIDQEFIPLKLNKSTPDSAMQYNRDGALYISWESCYLPNTVVHRLMIIRATELSYDCVWRNGAILKTSDGKQEALVQLTDWRDYKLEIFVQGEDKRQYMEELRRDILEIFKQLNLAPKEIIHFPWEGKMREIPYCRVKNAYLRHMSEVQLDDEDVESYPAPGQILQEYHVDYRKTRQLQISIHGNIYGGTFANASTLATIHVPEDESGTVDLEAVAQKISNCNMNKTELNELIALLDKLLLQRGATEQLPGLKEAVQVSKPSRYGEAVRRFLSNTANLASIISFGVEHAKEIIDFIRNL